MELKREVRCQRCPRVEHVDISFAEVLAEAKAAEEGTAVEKTKALEVKMKGTAVVEYDALCSVCIEIVTKHIEQMGAVAKKSSLREKT